MNLTSELPMLIREEVPADRDSVYTVNFAAFGTRAEAELVEQLRRDDQVIVSLVATVHDGVVGHVLFCDLQVNSPGSSFTGAALAPLAVLPAYQNRGIGSRLAQQGIQACRNAGVDIVLVVGDPRYYRRFGFTSVLAANLTTPYSGESLMALKLSYGALNIDRAIVDYPDAFSHVS